MSTVNVRYIVDDVEAAIAWYTKHLGFTLLSMPPRLLPT
jgi:catechol 2,3-dioxygenase-like lactoylglutathione lyase family enzyme